MVEVIRAKKPKKPKNPKADPKDPVSETPAPVDTEETPVTEVPATPDRDPIPATPEPTPETAPSHEPATAPDDPEEAANDPLLTVPKSKPIPSEPDHYDPGPKLVEAPDFDKIVETDPSDGEYPRAEATLGAEQPVPKKNGNDTPDTELFVPPGHIRVKCRSERGVFASGQLLEKGRVAAISAEDADALGDVIERV